VGFSITGLFSSLVPAFLGSVLHEHNLAIVGVIAAAVMLVAAVTQFAVGAGRERAALAGALLLLIAGLAGVESGLWARSLRLFPCGHGCLGRCSRLCIQGRHRGHPRDRVARAPSRPDRDVLPYRLCRSHDPHSRRRGFERVDECAQRHADRCERGRAYNPGSDAAPSGGINLMSPVTVTPAELPGAGNCVVHKRAPKSDGVGCPGGIAPPGSLGSRRDSLPSPGSSDQPSVPKTSPKPQQPGSRTLKPAHHNPEHRPGRHYASTTHRIRPIRANSRSYSVDQG
jgi:hypothetical protein